MDILRACQFLDSQPRPTEAEVEAIRQRYATALARFVQKRREELELPVATAAELAGLQLSEWLALEAGWIPDDHMVLDAIAGALSVAWNDLSILALFSRAAYPAQS